ncbi:MAG: hypothetical protein IMY72_01270 [Bacteroidetes bacterium]|nr:hypothetical protein [Bacteroidota bacterium]
MNYKKLYFLILVIGIVALSIISWYTLTININQTTPTIVNIFLHYNKLFIYCNLLLFIILLIISNLIYLKTLSKYFFTLSVIFFIAFTITNNFYFSNYILHHFSGYGLNEENFNLLKLIGAFSCLATIIITAINYTTIRNLKRRKK